MEINEIKKLFKGKFKLGDSCSKKVLILDNKICEVKEKLLKNPQLKEILVELLIMKCIIELNDEKYPFEIVQEVYEIDKFNIKALILEIRLENWVYGKIQEVTIKKVSNILIKNINTSFIYFGILKYYEAFYNFELNNLDRGFECINKSLSYWDKNSSAYRLYGYMLEKIGKIDESKGMYKLEKLNMHYYRINISEYNWSDFDFYMYKIAQNLDIIEEN